MEDNSKIKLNNLNINESAEKDDTNKIEDAKNEYEMKSKIQK